MQRLRPITEWATTDDRATVLSQLERLSGKRRLKIYNGGDFL